MNTIHSILFFALASAPLVAAPVHTGATTLAAYRLVGEDPAKPKMVTGTVKEKGEKELVIRQAEGDKETKITVTKDTKYKKAEKPATLDDVIVGSRVEIKLKGDTQEALEVNILADQK